MMKYLIDHSKKIIHRTPFAGDRCEFHTTPIKEREGSRDSLYLEKLIETKAYEVCNHCSGSLKEERDHLL
ncbi:hypothetical protein ABFG93_07195 [Pseudalkalibacillus hwajinpoensis]|uniref:hypothetical protein n=1 Tax=Guptibacillus hwajinpoensis TaxID=208199 RepID=UPI00325BBEC7